MVAKIKTSLENIKLGWKSFLRTNTQAYWAILSYEENMVF
jgi:hypothetical protein